MLHYTRIESLNKAIKENHYTDLIISNPTTIAYLTTYQNYDPGERLFILHLNEKGHITLYLNRLFPEPSSLAIDCNIIWYRDGENIFEEMVKHLNNNGKIGVDKDWPSHFLLSLMEQMPHAQFKNGSPLSDRLRSIKSNEEQEMMAEASRLNDHAMEYLIQLVAKGLPETEMVALLKQKYQELNCDGFSFEPIIAYGPNGADPHHTTNNDQPKIGDSVVIDIGSFYQGYASDMTRTVFYGEPSKKAREIYELVKKANLAAINQVRPGVTFASIDQAARKVIEVAGYGQYFTHRTGHSIGIEVHEPGDVGAFNQDIVEVGNVFSIEPGIYLPGELGVRIEDLVIVTEEGCRVINNVTKDLISCQPSLA